MLDNILFVLTIFVTPFLLVVLTRFYIWVFSNIEGWFEKHFKKKGKKLNDTIS